MATTTITPKQWATAQVQAAMQGIRLILGGELFGSLAQPVEVSS